MDILKRVGKLINMADGLVKEHPSDARLKVVLLSLEEMKSEISKSELNKAKLNQLGYGITRVYTDMLDYEKTPFGEELVKLLLEYNDLCDTL